MAWHVGLRARSTLGPCPTRGATEGYGVLRCGGQVHRPYDLSHPFSLCLCICGIGSGLCICGIGLRPQTHSEGREHLYYWHVCKTDASACEIVNWLQSIYFQGMLMHSRPRDLRPIILRLHHRYLHVSQHGICCLHHLHHLRGLQEGRVDMAMAMAMECTGSCQASIMCLTDDFCEVNYIHYL